MTLSHLEHSKENKTESSVSKGSADKKEPKTLGRTKWDEKIKYKQVKVAKVRGT